MTKEELVRSIWEEAELDSKKKAEEALDALLAAMTAELAAGGTVSVRDFGTFSVRERAARTGRNPQTGAAIQIPAHKVVAFKPGKHLAQLGERANAGEAQDWLDYRRYVRSMERQLSDLKKSLDKYRGQGFGLGEQYAAARTRLRELADSSGQAWREVSKGFESAYDELKSAFRKAAGRF